MRIQHLHLSLLFWVSAVTLVISLVFGGGTRAGFSGDVLIQFVAVGLLVSAIARLLSNTEPLARDVRLAIAFCVALVCVPLVQLVPLPPSVRVLLPGHTWIAESYDLVGRTMPWWPISVAPEVTWTALLSLIAPLALFLGVLQLDYRERRYLVAILITLAMVSVILGAIQLAQGDNSSLRFYAITNTTEAVGFFANRNHYAALLYCATLLIASFAMDGLVGAQSAFRLGGLSAVEGRRILVIGATIVVFIALVMAQAMARSRAGIVFTIAGLFGVLGVAMTYQRSQGDEARGARILAGAAIVAVVLSLQYAMLRIIERFAEDPIEQTRIITTIKTLEAAKSFLPFGAGTGAFVPVYALFETPKDLNTYYVNHAHNDIAESLLESGVLSFALMCAFALFLTMRLVSIWRGKAHPLATSLDAGLIKAASLALVLLALHSLVDYPLRTGAGLAIAALCCGLLFVPLPMRAKDGANAAHAAGVGGTTGGRKQRDVELQGAVDEGNARERVSQKHNRDDPKHFSDPRAAHEAREATSFKRWENDKSWPQEWQSRQSSQGDTQNAVNEAQKVWPTRDSSLNSDAGDDAPLDPPPPSKGD